MGEMTMIEWAQNEIAIACANERGSAPEGEWDYGVACYQSALRAFNSLTKDGHSGFSIQMTKHILDRLIDGKCLTPIVDEPHVWFDDPTYHEWDGTYSYQCKRCFSLFKDVYPDGTVKYRDNDRYYCQNILSPFSTFTCSIGNQIMDELFPIEMPYMPETNKYVINIEDFVHDAPENSHSDYDTMAFYSVTTPDGSSIEINRFYKETETGMKEITYAEFLERKAVYTAKLNEEEPKND